MQAFLTTRYPSLASDPFLSLHRALNRSFDYGRRSSGERSIALDVREDEKAFHISADLPGLSEKEIEVSFDDGLLTLSGEKKVARDEKTDTWHIVERSSGTFKRQLSLNSPVDADAIEAKFDKGVLTVTLPKLAPEKPSARKIEIKTN